MDYSMSMIQNVQRIALYSRVSTDEQAERGTIDIQVAAIEQWAERFNARVVDRYLDDGVSGTRPMAERPAGSRLMQDIDKRIFDTVVVFNISRLARSSLVALQVADELKRAGVALVSVTEPFDTSTPIGAFMLGLLAQVAQLERASILERTMLGTIKAVKQGKWVGGIVPYGYIVDSDTKLSIANTEKLPGLDLTEADVIRMMYKMVGEDRSSCIKVADRLNALRIPTSYSKENRKLKKGKRLENTAGVWTAPRIRNIVISTTYKGLHYYNKRSKKPKKELIERSVPAIVSSELWQKAQDGLKHNRIAATRNAKREYLLRSLIHCGLCGRNYSGTAYSSKKGLLKPYYVCNGKNAQLLDSSKAKCQSPSISGKEIENQIWEECLSFLMNPGDTILQLKNTQIPIEEKRKKLIADVDTIYDALQDNKDQRNELIDLHLKRIISEEDLKTKLTALSDYEKRAKDEIASLKNEIADLTIESVDTDNISALLDSLRQKAQGELTFSIKREIISVLVKEIIVLPENEAKTSKVHIKTVFFFPKVVNYTGSDSFSRPSSSTMETPAIFSPNIFVQAALYWRSTFKSPPKVKNPWFALSNSS